MDQYGIPSLEELRQYNVNRPDQIEAIKQSLYDSQTYAAAGQTQLIFFQQPKGGASGKTLQDTNMTGAGALPAPQSFLVETIELFVFPNQDVTVLNAGASFQPEFANDVYDIARFGWLEFFIGSKPYLDEAPLLKFPPRSGLTIAADSSAVAPAAGQLATNYASFGGPIYALMPPILLVPTQNFEITLNWPAAVPISTTAKVFVNLGGILYRNSQ